MDVSTDSEFIDAVASESGLLEEQSQLADSTVLELLKGSYGLRGALVRIPTEKDETFRLRVPGRTWPCHVHLHRVRSQ